MDDFLKRITVDLPLIEEAKRQARETYKATMRKIAETEETAGLNKGGENV